MKLVVETAGDPTHDTVKRQLRKHNYGFYCEAENCREFTALFVSPNGQADIQVEAEPAGSLITFDCSMCSRKQAVSANDLKWVLLTEGLKRRPFRPAQ